MLTSEREPPPAQTGSGFRLHLSPAVTVRQFMHSITLQSKQTAAQQGPPKKPKHVAVNE